MSFDFLPWRQCAILLVYVTAREDMGRGKRGRCLYAVEEEDFVGGGDQEYTACRFSPRL